MYALPIVQSRPPALCRNRPHRWRTIQCAATKAETKLILNLRNEAVGLLQHHPRLFNFSFGQILGKAFSHLFGKKPTEIGRAKMTQLRYFYLCNLAHPMFFHRVEYRGKYFGTKRL